MYPIDKEKEKAILNILANLMIVIYEKDKPQSKKMFFDKLWGTAFIRTSAMFPRYEEMFKSEKLKMPVL